MANGGREQPAETEGAGPLAAAVAAVALALGGLLVGFEPQGGDPDCLYRPIKGELAEALARGSLPFWSDRFGLGVPLAAESHAAAFYPANILMYRVLNVGTAYRLSIWLHYLALAAATYGYARVLRLPPRGAGLAALAFTLSGFQASHACHEPFYSLLPYLPLALLLAEKYLTAGGLAWLAGLALAVGAQVTLGHFQLQFWTIGLVAVTALWRAFAGVGPRGLRWRRAAGVLAALGWGVLVASAQLGLTFEMTRQARFDRPMIYLTNYAFPPSHWAQPALPRLFAKFLGGPLNPYWSKQATSGDESCFYLGSVALVLAGPGLVARRDRALAPWLWLSAAGLVLATMPHWWHDGYMGLLHLPGFGHFRAPGRYVLLPSLGLSLLAGRGFDRSLPAGRFWTGYGLSAAFAAAALGYGVVWSGTPEMLAAIGSGPRLRHLAEGAVGLSLAFAAVAVWRRRGGPVAAWAVFGLAAVELTYLYYGGTTPWGWATDFPRDSPVFRALVADRARGAGLVAGFELQDLPVRAGLTTAFPNLGIVAPPPNYLLENSQHPAAFTPEYQRWLRRFGVTHGVFDGPTPFRPSEVLYLGPDPMLDALLSPKPSHPLPRTYRVERYPDPFPAARAATSARVVADWYETYPALSQSDDPAVAWFERADAPPDPPGPRATSARVVSWDGRTAVVEHDGTVDLVLRRTHYPGWTARVNGGPPMPVLRADGGLQAVRLAGRGPSTVLLSYRPTRLGAGLAVSGVAAGGALAVLLTAGLRWSRFRGGRVDAAPGGR